jgi:hypothetical protein
MKIDVKVIFDDGRRVTRHLRTPAHTRLTEVGKEALLHQEADRLEQFFPGLEFRLVPLQGGSFNFVQIPPEMTAVTE